MAIKTIEYKVTLGGITPATEQFSGTQGDHRVTKIEFEIEDQLGDAINDYAAEMGGKAMYRFDIYDGEGGVWSSEAEELNEYTVSIELEERHTRHGGKVTVYLVLTALSSDNETEIELYSFPAVLRLKNRPEGEYQDSENYESMTTLAESARADALSAEASKRELQDFAAEIEEKLNNGDFDGVGVKSAEIVNDELIITYTDDTLQNLGNVKGDTGLQGIQGVQGEAGKDGSDGVGIASVYIEDGYLYVRKTNETTAQNLGRVKGDKGDTGNAVAEGVVDAVADTIPLRDGKSALNVGLTFKDISNGLPVPMRMLDDGENNIIYWDGTVAASFSSTAAGTEDDPIIISTAEELAYLVKNASKSMTVFSTEDANGNTVYKPKYFKIADGIDAIVLQNKTYANEIIALSSSADVYDYFTDENKTFSEWVGTGWEQTMFGGHFDG
ncbi:MAG: hypothetical protein IJZ21_01900, partial [Clostridia bacterium]|nr:hypothetical protein [Clostridia bacterium]